VWTPEPARTLPRKEKSLSLAGIEPGFLGRPDRKAISTDIIIIIIIIIIISGDGAVFHSALQTEV
jgi:hypothetical protein